MAQSFNRKKLIRLVQKYLAGKASQEEQQFLEAYYNTFEKEPDPLQAAGQQAKDDLSNDMKAAIWQQIAQREQAQVAIPFFKRTGIRMAMAAAILLLVSVPVYYFSSQPASKTSQLPIAKKQAPILPGGDKATLTLADGSVIELDTAQNGTISLQGATNVVKKDGRLQYTSAANNQTSEIIYNTIATPRGGQYHIVLSDGSNVWLNAASSIRFPATFTGKERLVEITGEAYFEITKNQHRPFKVITAPSGQGTAPGAVIEVLGTHFNVNAYADETDMKTTLLEGKVKMAPMASGEWSILKPGQQAAIHHSQLTIRDNVDLDEAIAWKNGLFYFDNADIQTIMRQLARWYQVEVSYKGNIPSRRFAGQVSRSTGLLQVLKILELSKVHFTIEGNKVTVMP
jgi:ferric-dicitrate binding protein FerR (iron transport regulator)